MSQVATEGIHVGHYAIEDEIGRGPMSVLYRAIDTRAERHVALKLLPRDILSNSEKRDRWELLAQGLQNLAHSNIVPVYDFGEHNGQPFIVTRLMRGFPLSEQIRLGPLSIIEAARYIEAVAPAIQRAHNNEIMHLNINPNNILFDDAGNPGVSDFSLAQFGLPYAQVGGSPVFGDPHYTAPEVGRKGGKGPLADVYALGVLLFHMLAGLPPYQGETPADILRAHIEKPVPNLRATRPDLPDSAQQVILGALSKDPYDRYGSISELEQDLLMIVEREIGISEQDLYAVSYPSPPSARPPQQIGEFDTMPEWFRGTGDDYTTTPAFEDFDALATMPDSPASRMAAAQLAGVDVANAEISAAESQLSARDRRLKAARERKALGAWRSKEARRQGRGELAVRLAGFTMPPVVQWSLIGTLVAILFLWLQIAGVIQYVSNTIQGITPEAVVQPPTPTSDIIQLFEYVPTVEPDLLQLAGHDQQVEVMAYDPQGGRFASGSEDNSIIIWNEDTGSPLELIGHRGKISDLAFSPDGRLLASASEDNTVLIWNVDSSIPVYTLTGHIEAGEIKGVDSLAWSPDGTRIATGGRDSRILIWRLGESGRAVQVDELSAGRNQVVGLAFNPNGTRLYSANGAVVILWDLETGNQIRVIDIDERLIFGFDMSPDGNVLAVGTGETLAFVNTGTGAILDTRKGRPFYNLAWSSDGRSLGIADLDKAQVISYPGKALIREYDAPDMDISSLAWSPDGTKLVTGAVGGRVILWGYDQGGYVGLLGPTDAPNNLDSAITLENIEDLAEWKWLGGHVDAARGISFSPDGSEMVSGTQGGVILAWDLALGVSYPPLNRDMDYLHWIMGLGYQPNGNLIAAALQNDELVYLWNADNLERRPEFLSGHTLGVTSLDWSPDGTLLAVGTGANAIFKWEFSPTLDDIPAASRVFNGHTAPVSDVMFNADGSKLASVEINVANNESRVFFWDVGTTDQLGEPVTLKGLVYQLDWAPSENLVAVSTAGIFVLDTGTNTVKAQNDSPGFRSVVWSADGTFLFAGTTDGQVLVLDQDASPIRSLQKTEGVHGGVAYLAVSPDARILASSYEDGLLVLWGITP